MKNDRLMRLLPRLDNLAHMVQNRHQLGASDVDDVRQEMAVAILEAPAGLSDACCLRRAVWRALDWVRRERGTRRQATPLPFEQIVELVDSGQCLRVWC